MGNSHYSPKKGILLGVLHHLSVLHHGKGRLGLNDRDYDGESTGVHHGCEHNPATILDGLARRAGLHV